jgi:hypothetical protein
VLRATLCRYTIDQLNGYDFFAGHLDWSDLDCLQGDRFTFAVLRQPLERAVSQYCHWRDRAHETFTNGDIPPAEQKPIQHLIHTAPACEFFQRLPTTRWGDALLDWFDNLYTYFFFYRGYKGRRSARLNCLSTTNVLEIALANMAHVDYVATFAHLEDDLHEIERLTGLRFAQDVRVEHRTTFGAGIDRVSLARQMDPSGCLLKQLKRYTALDDLIYELATRHGIGRARNVASVAGDVGSPSDKPSPSAPAFGAPS